MSHRDGPADDIEVLDLFDTDTGRVALVRVSHLAMVQLPDCAGTAAPGSRWIGYVDQRTGLDR